MSEDEGHSREWPFVLLISPGLGSASSPRNQLLRAIRAETTKHFKAFSFRLVVGDEGALDLVDQVAIQIAKEANVRVVARIRRDCDQPVVASRLFSLGLLRLDNSD